MKVVKLSLSMKGYVLYKRWPCSTYLLNRVNWIECSVTWSARNLALHVKLHSIQLSLSMSSRSWSEVTSHQSFITRSTWLGVATARTLKLDFGVKKWWNRKIIFGTFTYALQRCQNYENPVGRIDTLYMVDLLYFIMSKVAELSSWTLPRTDSDSSN